MAYEKKQIIDILNLNKMSKAIEITDSNIGEILRDNKITLIDFYAIWCGPCRILGPIIDELAGDNPDIAIGKLNVDENGDTTLKFGIRGIPAIIFFKDGKEVDKVVGVVSKSALQDKINILKS